MNQMPHKFYSQNIYHAHNWTYVHASTMFPTLRQSHGLCLQRRYIVEHNNNNNMSRLSFPVADIRVN